MTEKGLIRCEDKGGMKVYSPLIMREDAVVKETDDFLSRVYKGSLSLMVSTLTKKQALSQAELDELYGILQRMEEANSSD